MKSEPESEEQEQSPARQSPGANPYIGKTSAQLRKLAIADGARVDKNGCEHYDELWNADLKKWICPCHRKQKADENAIFQHMASRDSELALANNFSFNFADKYKRAILRYEALQ